MSITGIGGDTNTNSMVGLPAHDIRRTRRLSKTCQAEASALRLTSPSSVSAKSGSDTRTFDSSHLRTPTQHNGGALRQWSAKHSSNRSWASGRECATTPWAFRTYLGSDSLAARATSAARKDGWYATWSSSNAVKPDFPRALSSPLGCAIEAGSAANLSRRSCSFAPRTSKLGAPSPLDRPCGCCWLGEANSARTLPTEFVWRRLANAPSHKGLGGMVRRGGPGYDAGFWLASRSLRAYFTQEMPDAPSLVQNNPPSLVQLPWLPGSIPGEGRPWSVVSPDASSFLFLMRSARKWCCTLVRFEGGPNKDASARTCDRGAGTIARPKKSTGASSSPPPWRSPPRKSAESSESPIPPRTLASGFGKRGCGDTRNAWSCSHVVCDQAGVPTVCWCASRSHESCRMLSNGCVSTATCSQAQLLGAE